MSEGRRQPAGGRDRATDARMAAMEVLEAVCCRRRSLAAALPAALERLSGEERALAQALCYGVLRWQPRLQCVLAHLLQRPLKARDCDIQCLLLLGLYQLMYMRVPPHAAVSETVNGVGQSGKSWMRGMVNGVLRNFLRRRDEVREAVDRDEVGRYAHPRWMIDQLRSDWPDAWRSILHANNRHPPMTLRVNCRQSSRETYLAGLERAGLRGHAAAHADSAIVLETPVDAERLPGFAQGAVSVQDAAAQLAAPLLDARPGQRVLDACAAPGGKACHIFECQPAVGELVAVEVDVARLERMRENVRRTAARVTLVRGDAAAPETWWDGQPFDRILLDAPCSASGVIRRNPDIKILRERDDIGALIRLQSRLLRALWPLLRPGGLLLYATCSVFPGENHRQVENFLASHRDALAVPIAGAWGRDMTTGRQILPGEDEMDGFYYACIRKG